MVMRDRETASKGVDVRKKNEASVYCIVVELVNKASLTIRSSVVARI
jgi:hypothetical protein